MPEHGLRDLARSIERLAHKHPCWAQAAKPIANLCDHLQAMAGHHELIHKLHEVTEGKRLDRARRRRIKRAEVQIEIPIVK